MFQDIIFTTHNDIPKNYPGTYHLEVITAKPETEIQKIARESTGEHVGVTPIDGKEGGLIGIITRNSILRALVN